MADIPINTTAEKIEKAANNIDNKMDKPIQKVANNLVAMNAQGNAINSNISIEDIQALEQSVSELENSLEALAEDVANKLDVPDGDDVGIVELRADKTLLPTNVTVKKSASTWLSQDDRVSTNLAIDNRINEKITPTIQISGSPSISITLSHNLDFRCTNSITASINISLPSTIPNYFKCSVAFQGVTSGASIILPSTVKYTGEDVVNGTFTPVSNKRYTMRFWYDSKFVICQIIGVGT